MPMPQNVYKPPISSKQLEMSAHICRILDNEYYLIVKEIDSRMGTLSEITQIEIRTKLKNLTNKCHKNLNLNLSDRQQRNEKARQLVELTRRFSRQDNRPSTPIGGRFHNLPQHIINKSVLLGCKEPKISDSQDTNSQSKNTLNLKRLILKKQQNLSSCFNYYSVKKKDSQDTDCSSNDKNNRTQTEGNEWTMKENRQTSKTYHSSGFHTRSAKIKSSLEQMLNCHQSFTDFIDDIKK